MAAPAATAKRASQAAAALGRQPPPRSACNSRRANGATAVQIAGFRKRRGRHAGGR